MTFSRLVPRLCGVMALALFLSPTLSAQEAPPPIAWVPTDAIAVADIDLTAVDLAAIFDTLDQIAPQPVPPMVRMTVGAYVQSLRDAGVEHVYATLSLRRLTQGGLFVIVPARDVDAVERLVAGVVGSLPQNFPYAIVKRDGAVIVCPKDSVAEIESGDAALAAERIARFTHALNSLGDRPHRLAIALPEDIRGEMAAIWPDAMAVAEGVTISPRRMLSNASSLAIGVSLPPEIGAEVRIASQSAEGAKVIHDQLTTLLGLIPQTLPKPELEVEEAAVVAEVGAQQIETLRAALITPARRRAGNQVASNQFKQLGLALHNYASSFTHFPGKYTVDAERRPLLSWRVALLPFLEQAPLYERFKLDEPWDSPHNRALVAEMPDVFAIPGDDLPPGMTRIRLPVVEGGLWHGEGPPRTFRDVRDGTSNTIWVAVAPKDAAVEWTKPDDWQLAAEDLVNAFFGRSDSAIVGILDGSVRTISRETSAEVLRALLTMAGGEVVDYDEVK